MYFNKIHNGYRLEENKYLSENEIYKLYRTTADAWTPFSGLFRLTAMKEQTEILSPAKPFLTSAT